MSTIQGQYNQSQDLADSLRTQKKQKEELQASHEREMENLKKAYSSEKAESQDRFEASSQNDRLNHYEHLRNQKSQINREERDLESRGRESIASKTQKLQTEETLADQEGRKRVDDTLKKYATLEEFERQAMKQANDEAHQIHLKNTQSIIENAEEEIEHLRSDKMSYLDERKQNHSTALNEIQDHYQGLRGDFEERNHKELSSLEEKGFKELNQKRLDTAQILSRYDQQKQDPFYQVQRFETAITDEGNAYQLKVKVPEHERKNLRLQATGQDIQIIGVRTSDQEAFEQGRAITSRTHQTVSEKFNLNAPVDPKAITRMETGEWVEFRIPKFGAEHRMNPSPQASDASRDNVKIAKEIRFAETLPTPRFKHTV